MAAPQLSSTLLLAVPMAPLLGAVLAGVLGTTLGGRVLGRRLAHTLTILGVFIAFVISAMTLKSVAVDGARFDATIYEWMTLGSLKMEVGFLIDGLSAMMMFVVTFVSLMVHIYTIGYMAEIGVGPSIESGSQTCSGNCALLPIAPMKRQMQITVTSIHSVPGKPSLASSAPWPNTSA